MARKITEKKIWSAESVIRACVKNDLYTDGDNEEYEHMLSWVKRLYPNTENLCFVAENIKEHSEGQTVSNVMFILANEAVTTCFEIEGEE